MQKLTEEQIREFLERMYHEDSRDMQSFMLAKNVSDLDWRTLISEAIHDWIRVDKEQNSYRWDNKSPKHE